jgi:hypothetical protein
MERAAEEASLSIVRHRKLLGIMPICCNTYAVNTATARIALASAILLYGSPNE